MSKSNVMDPDEKFSYKFTKAGTYPLLLLGPPEDEEFRLANRRVLLFSEERSD